MNEQDGWDILGSNTRLDVVCVEGIVLQPGDRVRLQPKGRADAFDMMLAGRAATIESIEQDYEDRVYVVVTVDDDPGREFGLARKPGHRFFFAPEEVQPIGSDEKKAS